MIQESLDDFRRRYRNTFVFLEINGKQHLSQYIEDNGEDFIFYSPKVGEILVGNYTARESITTKFPKAGLYNINNRVYQFNRQPARQWKRAPCPDNTSLREILPRFFGINHAKTYLGTENAQDIFFPRYPVDLHSAISSLKEVIALSTELAVSVKTTKEKTGPLLLWYKGNPIGWVNQSDAIIEVCYPPLFQEVLDHFRKKDASWTVLQRK